VPFDRLLVRFLAGLAGQLGATSSSSASSVAVASSCVTVATSVAIRR